MTTAEAITALRRKTSLSQRGLAEQLGVTITSISRYENGREPSRDVLKRLSEIAASAQLSSLAAFFEKQIRSGIAEKIANLPSAGTQRRVSVSDLERWAKQQTAIALTLRGLSDMLKSVSKDVLDKALQGEEEVNADDLLRGLRGMARNLEIIAADAHVYLSGRNPPKRGVSPGLQQVFRLLAEIENHEKEKSK